MLHDLPPRIVHLPGGLRAVDDRTGKCTIQLNTKQILGSFDTSEYARLYSELNGLSFTPLGCEFVNTGSYQGIQPPDWEVASPNGGFAILEERNEWNNVRFAKGDTGEFDLADIAGRTSMYLQLLAIRLFQLSQSYNNMLSCWAQNSKRKIGHLIDNAYMNYIDAAVHGFVADAASFRDLIAESIWRLVLKREPSVASLSTLIKQSIDSSCPLTQSVLDAAREGGWLFNFSKLRNDIIHVAPIGRGSGNHMCLVKGNLLGSDNVPMLHYPLLQADETIYKSPPIDVRTDESVKRALREYRDFCVRSIDALEYAWRTANKLVETQRDVRLAAGLAADFPHIKDATSSAMLSGLPAGQSTSSGRS